MPSMNLQVHSKTCCNNRHASPYRTFILRWISMGFTPSLLKKRMTDAVLLWCMLQAGRHLYTTTASWCCIPAPYCHLSATLQTMSIIVFNLQDNWTVFRIFIALLMFSFDCPPFLWELLLVMDSINQITFKVCYKIFIFFLWPCSPQEGYGLLILDEVF